MERIFFEITVIICLAAVLALLFRLLKQPAILAYILAGIIVGPLSLIHLEGGDIMQGLAQIGITLLLFMLGLELRLSELKSVGKTALLTGVGQILFTSTIGFFICLLLGFSQLTSLYLAIALTFSSTIIIVKLLSDKKDLNSLYGKIAIGMLLIQDFVAVIALIILSGFGASVATDLSAIHFLLIFLKAVVLFAGVIFLSKAVLPKIIGRVAHSPEILFVCSLAWAFGVAALVSSPFVGFSIEIGGFLAGLALANTNENLQIAAKVRPLRDFFITIFFVTLGMRLVFENIGDIWFPALVLSFFVLIGNPLILMTLLGLLGYRKRTSFLVGLTVAQISEFSMIVIFMGNKIGHLSDEIVSLITLSGTITFVLSTYMILNGNKLYAILSPYLDIFERKNTREQKIDVGNLKNHIVLIGAHRMGEGVLEALLHNGEDVVVVDFNPDIVKKLQEQGVKSFFGDIADSDIQERVGFDTAKLVISTVPDLEDNLFLIEGLRRANKKATVVVMALEKLDAKRLYEAGANYVVLPHLAGGRHLAKILVDKNHLELIENYKMKDLPSLEK